MGLSMMPLFSLGSNTLDSVYVSLLVLSMEREESRNDRTTHANEAVLLKLGLPLFLQLTQKGRQTLSLSMRKSVLVAEVEIIPQPFLVYPMGPIGEGLLPQPALKLRFQLTGDTYHVGYIDPPVTLFRMISGR